MFKLEFKWRNPYQFDSGGPNLPSDIVVSTPPRVGDVLEYDMTTFQVYEIMWKIKRLKNPEGVNIVTILVTVT